jgi:integrase
MCNDEARECAPKTLKSAWGLISSVLRAVNVLPPKITLPQVPPNERPFLEPEEIPQFIKAVSGTSLEIPALLALSSMRLSEICALTWSNVDLKKRCIYVRGAKVPGADQKFVQKQTNKNRSSTRTVPIMIDELWNALSATEDKTGLVYMGHPDSLRRQVNRLCKANSLPEVGVHGLRHSFASLAYHIGMPEKVTMEIGGWSDNQTMRKIYTHVAQSDRSKYANAMADFFKQNAQS